jgi:predicted alpha/beta superfamily hydrolase
MKPSSIFLVLAICFALQLNLFAQQGTGIQVGISDTLHSKILNEDRRIQIYLPGNYESSQQHYPVMYLCDGQWNFLHTLGIIDFMAGTRCAPRMILVSIYHTNRDEDLVPKTTETDNYSGNADGFMDFIAKELIPHVEGKFRTQPFRILTGISYGGLFTNYTLITKPDLFDAYISIDPSLWWDNQRMIHDSEKFLQKQESFDKILYFTQSEIREMGGDKFAKMLHRAAPRGLKWKFNHMHQETHASITHRSIYDGLEFIFSDWSPDPVAVKPNGGIFRKNDSLVVELSHQTAISIHYTSNGDEPTLQSAVYEKPIIITKPCVLKTKPVFDYEISGNCDSVQFEIAVLQLADKKVKNLKRGLSYNLYEGDWDKLPDFDKLKTKSTGVADTVNAAYSSLQDHFGLIFNGYINIAKEGIYTFYLRSDDGSRLKIGDKELIDLDGLHAVTERSKQILLEKGKHKINIEFFEKGGGQFLELNYDGPDLKRQVVPAKALYHSP